MTSLTDTLFEQKQTEVVLPRNSEKAQKVLEGLDGTVDRILLVLETGKYEVWAKMAKQSSLISQSRTALRKKILNSCSSDSLRVAPIRPEPRNSSRLHLRKRRAFCRSRLRRRWKRLMKNRISGNLKRLLRKRSFKIYRRTNSQTWSRRRWRTPCFSPRLSMNDAVTATN